MKQDQDKVFRQIHLAIAEASATLVTSHRDCDGDSVGGQLAMAEFVASFGKDVTVYHHGPVPDTLSEVSGIERIVDVSSAGQSEFTPEKNFDLVVVLECSDVTRVGDVQRYIRGGVPVINIDHHADNNGYGDVRWLDAGASSVCEMLARFFKGVGYDYDATVAEQLYTGILTDTGRFRYNSATALTFATTAEIVSRGINVQEICDRIYFSRRAEALRLAGLALSEIQFSANGQVCVIPLTQEMLKRAGARQDDTEGLSDYTLSGKSTQVGAFIRENGSGAIKVSLRSRGDWDVASVAAQFGGGGHRNAAGCVLEEPIDSATRTITERLQKLVQSNGAGGTR